MARASGLLRRPIILVAIGAGVVVLLAAAAFALRGSTGRVATPERGPATVAPPEVAVYAEVFLHPTGEQGVNSRKLLARALGEKDPGARLGDIVGRKVDGGRGIAYAADVKPWLGSRAAVFFRAVAGPRSKPVLILETTSPSRARASLVTGPGAGPKLTNRGVQVARRPDGTSAAVVGKYAVVGDLAGVRSSIDAHQGYDLGTTDRFRSGSRKAKEDRVGFLWVDLRMFGDLLATPLVGGARGREYRERLELTDPSPVVANLSAKPTALFADFGPRPGDTVNPADNGGGNAAGGQGDGGTPPGEPAGGGGPAPGAPTQGSGTGLEAGPGSGAAPGAPGSGLTLLPAPLLPEVPADSWLAVGIPDFGSRTGQLVDPAINPALPLDQVEPMLAKLRKEGLDLRGKVLPALGGMAAFVRGGRAGKFEGAAIIEANDPKLAQTAVTELATILGRRPGFRVSPADLPGGVDGWRVDQKSLPAPLYLRARGNRIVIALGRAAALDALDSPRKLADTPGFKAAAAVLAPSLRPDGYLDMPQALKIADRSGVARSSAAYRTARPALDVVSWVAFAAKNRIRRFAIGIG